MTFAPHETSELPTLALAERPMRVTVLASDDDDPAAVTAVASALGATFACPVSRSTALPEHHAGAGPAAGTGRMLCVAISTARRQRVRQPRELAHAIDDGGAVVLVGPRCGPWWRPGDGAVLASSSAGSTGYELLAHAGAVARDVHCALWLTLARGDTVQPDEGGLRLELLAANTLGRMSRAVDGHGLTVGWDVMHSSLHRGVGTFGEALSMIALEVERCDRHGRRELWSEAIAVARRSNVPVMAVAASVRPLPHAPPVQARAVAPAPPRRRPSPTDEVPAAREEPLRDHRTILTLLGPAASAPPVPAPDPRPPLTRRARVGVVASIAVLVAIALTLVARVEVPYATVEPGAAPNLARRITVVGTETHPIRAPIRYLTVRTERATLFAALRGWLDGDVDVVPDPNTAAEAHRAWSINNELMIASKQTAELVALSVLGERIIEYGEGARVVETTPGSPASSTLQVGDVIVGVDRRQADTAAAVAEAVARDRREGFYVLQVRRLGASAAVNVAVASRSSSDGAPPRLGAALETVDPHLDAVDLRIDTADVVGPSAGLAFTIATIDVLSPGDLTGGITVAATGTIDLDGQVGVVGALRQKVVAALRARADVLLVPIEQALEADRHANGVVRVIGVHTIDDALAALERLGGDRPGLPARRTRLPSSTSSI